MLAMGLCFSDLYTDDMLDNDYTGERTLASVHFAGRYRLVDFALSNMVNSGVYRIGIIVESKYQSLMSHIGSGKDWDLSRKSGGVTLLPPNIANRDTVSYRGRMDALNSIKDYIDAEPSDYVIITDSNILCNIDYREVIAAHEDSLADITCLYRKDVIEPSSKDNSISYIIGEDNRIEEILVKPTDEGEVNLAMNTWVMRTSLLIHLLETEIPRGMWRFIRDVLSPALKRMNVIGYEFKGYCAHICSMNSYFTHNMEMLENNNRASLFGYEGRSILTSVRDSTPTRYGSSANIHNSIVADGCLIEGEVDNSIIFRNVHIKPGAIVKNSIIMADTIVEENARLEWIVSDKYVTIQENRNLMAFQTHPFYIPKGKVI